MIYCETKNYAKIWDVKKEEKYMDLRITTSEKDKDGNYVDSTWFARCLGHSYNALKDAQKGDRIILNKVKLTNRRYKAKDGTYKTAFELLVIDADFVNKKKTESEEPAVTVSAKPQTDDCPW